MEFSAVVTSFGLIFVMELGDKTQIAVLGLSARSEHRRAVFLGAVGAFGILTGLAVALGSLVSEFVSGDLLSVIAAAGFIGIGLLAVWSTFRGKAHSDEPATASTHGDRQTASVLRLAAITFGLTFVSEMGDKSQLGIISATVRTVRPFEVFLGAMSALALVTLIAIVAGKMLAGFVSGLWISGGAATIFIVVGVLMLMDVI